MVMFITVFGKNTLQCASARNYKCGENFKNSTGSSLKSHPFIRTIQIFPLKCAMLNYLHPPPFKKFSSCILHRSKLKSCIKTGPTLKGHNILTFDLNLLTQIYFFSSRREHFKTIKHMLFTLIFKKKLVKFNRFLSESFQPLDPCVSSEKSCYL